MICSCQPTRKAGHDDACLVAQAMRYRCPDCRSRRRGAVVTHANHCPLKDQQP